MARPHDMNPLPEHPALGKKIKLMEKYGAMTPCSELICASCKARRWMPLYTLRQYLSRGERFTGHCRSCKSPAIRAGHQMWLTKGGKGKHRSSNGYVQLTRTSIAEVDLPMYDAMRKSAASVSEHRMVMARHLGRPLESWELVDHMDGDKTNNSLENLRIYVRGKNHPGSANGHGTYYHEWQMALARIRRLEGR